MLTWSSFKVNSDRSSSSATVGIVTTDMIKLAHCLPLCTVYTACRDVAVWNPQKILVWMNKKQEYMKKALHDRSLNWFKLANHLLHLGFYLQASVFFFVCLRKRVSRSVSYGQEASPLVSSDSHLLIWTGIHLCCLTLRQQLVVAGNKTAKKLAQILSQRELLAN